MTGKEREQSIFLGLSVVFFPPFSTSRTSKTKCLVDFYCCLEENIGSSCRLKAHKHAVFLDVECIQAFKNIVKVKAVSNLWRLRLLKASVSTSYRHLFYSIRFYDDLSPNWSRDFPQNQFDRSFWLLKDFNEIKFTLWNFFRNTKSVKKGILKTEN